MSSLFANRRKKARKVGQEEDEDGSDSIDQGENSLFLERGMDTILTVFRFRFRCSKALQHKAETEIEVAPVVWSW